MKKKGKFHSGTGKLPVWQFDCTSLKQEVHCVSLLMWTGSHHHTSVVVSTKAHTKTEPSAYFEQRDNEQKPWPCFYGWGESKNHLDVLAVAKRSSSSSSNRLPLGGALALGRLDGALTLAFIPPVLVSVLPVPGWEPNHWSCHSQIDPITDTVSCYSPRKSPFFMHL